MKGRKPIPSKIIALRGGRSYTHRPPRENEPMPPEKLPPCPKHLTGVARKEWRRVGRLLMAVRVISELDRAILTGYCQSWAEYVAACEEVPKHKPVYLVKDPNTGQPIPKLNPWIRVEREAFERMVKSAMELGLSPVSRTRIKVENPNQQTKFSGLIGGKAHEAR